MKDADEESYSIEFLRELIVLRYEKRVSHLDAINELPLYPNEVC